MRWAQSSTEVQDGLLVDRYVLLLKRKRCMLPEDA